MTDTITQAALQALTAMENFIAKVQLGKARSIESYKQFQEAANAIHAALAAPQPCQSKPAEIDKQDALFLKDWALAAPQPVIGMQTLHDSITADPSLCDIDEPVKQAQIKSFKELEYKVGWQRYEKVRKLNPRQFTELFMSTLDGKPFDEMVDEL